MPFVSLRNATFMKNEMTGINVTDEILSRYRADMSKEEGEETGIQIAREIIAKTTDFVDGYYFSYWKEQSVSKAILLTNKKCI